MFSSLLFQPSAPYSHFTHEVLNFKLLVPRLENSIPHDAFKFFQNAIQNTRILYLARNHGHH